MRTNRAANSATELETEVDTDADEPGAEIVAKVRPEKPRPTRAFCYPLPRYPIDGRSDPRARDTENMITLPYADGYEERFRSIVQPGWYCVELRSGNTILQSDVLEVKAGIRTIESDPPAQPSPPAAPSLTVEDMRSLLNEWKEGVKAEVVAELKSQQPAAPPPSSGIGVLEIIELLDKREERTLQRMSLTQQQPSAGDEIEKFVSLMERTAEARERLAPPPLDNPDASTVDKVISVADSALKNIPKLVPFIAQAAQARTAAHTQQAPAQQTPPQQTEAPANAPPAPHPPVTEPGQALTLDQAVFNLKTDIQEDNDPDDAVADIIKLRSEQPQLIPVIDAMLGKSNDELLSLLEQATGAHLGELANADEYLDGLKEGVRERIKPRAVQAPAVGLNGNGAHVSA